LHWLSLWWWYADASGYTKRKEVEKMAKRKQDRIDKSRDAMGMLSARNEENTRESCCHHHLMPPNLSSCRLAECGPNAKSP
jgi:hypothetical protein